MRIYKANILLKCMKKQKLVFLIERLDRLQNHDANFCEKSDFTYNLSVFIIIYLSFNYNLYYLIVLSFIRLELFVLFVRNEF